MCDRPKEFQSLCELLNSLIADTESSYGYDALAGAYKYPDECPDTQTFNSLDNESQMKLIGLLRELWAYRKSLVEEKPRIEYANTWNEVFRLAPNWPGFFAARRSAEMIPIAEWCKQKSAEFQAGMDALEEQFRKTHRN